MKAREKTSGDPWAEVNAKLNIAAGLLLIVFALIYIAYRLSI